MNNWSVYLGWGIISAVVLFPLSIHYLVQAFRYKRKGPSEIYESGMNTIGSANKPYSLGQLQIFFLYLGSMALGAVPLFYLIDWTRLKDQELLLGLAVSLCFLVLFIAYGLSFRSSPKGRTKLGGM